MAEFITIIVALPLLHLIGGFYYRLGLWLCRTAGRVMGASNPSVRPDREASRAS
jgi:hypothetical protein